MENVNLAKNILEGTIPIFGYPVMSFHEKKQPIRHRQNLIKTSVVSSVMKVRSNHQRTEIHMFVDEKNKFEER